MTVPVFRARLRAALVPAMLLALALAPAAEAGSYSVIACDATNANRSWTPYGDTALIAANASCLADSTLGMKVRNSLRAPGGTPLTAPHGASGGIQAVAPQGTIITRLRADATAFDELGQSGADGWRAGIRIDDGAHAWCALAAGCSQLTPLSIDLPMNAASVQLAAVCWRAGGCQRDRIRAAATLKSVTLELRDDWYPGVTILGGTFWGPGRWLHGTESLAIEGRDNAGVRSLHVRADNRELATRNLWCDPYAMAPCPRTATLEAASIDTTKLPDGPNTVAARVVDAGANEHNEFSTVLVDNVAPTAGVPTVAGGSGWRAKNEFQLGIDPKDGVGGSGVRSVSWEVCRLDGSDCVVKSVAGAPSSVATAVPGVGEWKARAWANDAVRRGPASGWSEPLRFDDTVPGAASVDAGSGWTRGEGDSKVVISLPGTAAKGPSGIAGYAVSRGAEVPGREISDAGERAIAELGQLPEGETAIRARAISGAGVAADQVGEGVVRIDRTAPVASLSAGEVPLVATDDRWLRDGVELVARAHDALSGMAAAPDEVPVTRGGYIEYRIDDAPAVRVRGPHARIAVDHDGLRSVTVRAVDAAGNASESQHASFRVDRGAPRGTFERRDPLHPRRVRATVSEDCIKAARLELQEHGRKDWIAYPARGERREVVAEIPDHRIPAGRYSARFRVEDCAGNTGLVYYGSEANPLDLRLPLRDLVVVNATLDAGRARAASRATVRSGSPVLVRGRVTALEGRAAAGQRVEFQERIGTRDWRVRAVRLSDEGGDVAARLSAGTSRAVRLVVPESEGTIGARSRSLAISVPAGVTLDVSRHSLRNGEAVTFSGRLKGGFVPRRGRELELQGFNPLRGRWQPVRTQGLRTSGSGRFSTSYRFTATVGATVTYRFRIRVAPRPEHPFAQGFSRTVRVTVRG